MKFNDFIVSEEKVRLDPKCWTGKKIGNPKTKVKGGVRVNNCVPAESVEEAVNPAQQAAIAIAKKKKAGVEESAPPGAKAERMVKHIKKGYAKDGKLSDKEKSIAYATTWKAHNKGVTEAMRPVPVDDQGNRIPDKMSSNAPNRPFGQPGDAKSSSQGVVTYTPTGIVHRSNHGDVTPRPRAVPEDYNPEYDDEAGMADNNLETLKRTVEGIDDLIQSGDNLPEWCQEKIAVAKSMLVAVWDYMYSEEASDEVDPEVDEMFEAMDQLAEEMAIKNRVSKDLVWEQFEAMPDNMLYETAAWRRKEGKSKKGGLNAKGVASYRRENPGSKLQTAVTTKPSKLKPGSKAAKRRKSFCARMGGVKGPMKKPNGKPTRKALALRKWNC